MTVMAVLWVCLLLPLALPVTVLLVQVLIARPPLAVRADAEDDNATRAPRPSVVVLVPAHDEATGIAETLAHLMPQLTPSDRILVVADNCTDNTASVARQCGVDVTERCDPANRGKGYALAHGVAAMRSDPPDLVIVVDADCTVMPWAIEHLARTANSHQRVAQALYLMQAPPGAGLTTRIAEFAWLVRNQVRPLGALRLGGSCQLMGSGMAFPWPLIASAELASGHIVEDMQLGIALTRTGHPPVFCPQALVVSWFPTDGHAQQIQRTRWEHGHLATLLRDAPALAWHGVRHHQWAIALAALDLGVPPLASLALVLMLVTLGAGLSMLTGGPVWPLATALLLAWMLALAIHRAWAGHGRHLISARDWLQLPWYVARKVPIYLRFVIGRRQQAWVRTGRDGETR